MGRAPRRSLKGQGCPITGSQRPVFSNGSLQAVQVPVTSSAQILSAVGAQHWLKIQEYISCLYNYVKMDSTVIHS